MKILNIENRTIYIFEDKERAFTMSRTFTKDTDIKIVCVTDEKIIVFDKDCEPLYAFDTEFYYIDKFGDCLCIMYKE